MSLKKLNEELKSLNEAIYDDEEQEQVDSFLDTIDYDALKNHFMSNVNPEVDYANLFQMFEALNLDEAKTYIKEFYIDNYESLEDIKQELDTLPKEYIREDLELSTKVKNAILKKDPKSEYEFKLKNININGDKKGCSGFVKKGNKVIYLTTEQSDSYLGYMYRSAKDFKDFSGGQNMWAKTFDQLIERVVSALS